jgi:hypothetical protein
LPGRIRQGVSSSAALLAKAFPQQFKNQPLNDKLRGGISPAELTIDSRKSEHAGSAIVNSGDQSQLLEERSRRAGQFEVEATDWLSIELVPVLLSSWMHHQGTGMAEISPSPGYLLIFSGQHQAKICIGMFMRSQVGSRAIGRFSERCAFDGPRSQDLTVNLGRGHRGKNTVLFYRLRSGYFTDLSFESAVPRQEMLEEAPLRAVFI